MPAYTSRLTLSCENGSCVIRCVGSRCRLIHGAHLIGFTGRSAASRLVVASRHVQRRQKNVREFWSVNWLDVPSLNSPKASPTKNVVGGFSPLFKKGAELIRHWISRKFNSFDVWNVNETYLSNCFEHNFHFFAISRFMGIFAQNSIVPLGMCEGGTQLFALYPNMQRKFSSFFAHLPHLPQCPQAKVRKNNYTYSGRAQKVGYPLHSTLRKRRDFAQILLEIEIFEYKILQQIWFFRIFSISVRNCAKSRRFRRVEWRGYPTFRALPEYVKKIFLNFRALPSFTSIPSTVRDFSQIWEIS